MKAKLKRVMPICLVVIFFIVALVAQHLPISNASESEVPNVQVTSNGDGTFNVTGLTSSMEYNVISATYDGTWEEGVDAVLKLLSECNLFVRYTGSSSVQIVPVRNNYAVTFSWEGGTNKNISLISEKDTYIDWGDGNAELVEKSTGKQTLTHDYSTADSYTVKIADNSITYLNCDNSGVTALDVTYSGKLEELHCSSNSISALKLNKNAALESLYCNNNSLTSLDLTNNGLLSKVSCVQSTLDSISVIESQFNDDEIFSVSEGKEEITESKALYKNDYTVVTKAAITIPSAPTVTAIKNEDGTYRLDGFDSTMEYNTEDPNSTTWTSYSTNSLQSIKFNETYYIRVKAVKNVNTVSLAQTVEVKVVKLEKISNEDGSEFVRIDGMRTDMEYNTVSADYTGEWKTWAEGELQNITEAGKYYVRLIGGNDVVAFSVTVVERADAPSVTCEYNADGTCKLVGMNTTMEYNTESSTSESWTRYEENTLQNISTATVYYIRVAKNGTNPSSKILALTVTPQIGANVSAVKNEDGSYRIDGMTTEMEYNDQSPTYTGEWKTWAEGELQNITESVSYYVRLKGQTAVTTLNIYVITAQENEDRSYTILGLTEKMEYNTVSAEYTGTWTPYIAGALDNVNEDVTYYIRVKKTDGEKAGKVVTVTVKIRPAAPNITCENNTDGSIKLLGLDTTMEYNTVSAEYTGTWTKYTEGDLSSITTSGTYYIRVAAVGETPAGRVKTVTVNAVTRPAAPNITYEYNADNSIKLLGLDTTMEYNTVSAEYTGTWTKYTEGDLSSITTSGTYYIRVAANGDTPSGAVCTMNILEATTYTVSYNANGGTGAPESQTKTQGTALTLSSTVPTKAGSTFKGWATSSTATTAEYAAGGTFTTDANTVLYAIWEEETYAIEFTWTPTAEETEGVSQLTKGVEIKATAATTISWGDGTETAVTAGTNLYTHTYATAGEYIVRIADNVVTELDLVRRISNSALSTSGSTVNNQVTALDVSNNTALTSLKCYYNNLTTLDVSKNTALTSLECRSNNLTTLDVSKNTALTNLYCSSNNLTTLDVSKNTALTTLYCYSNNLTSLDVSNNTALTYLDCSSNDLTTLDVSNNTALTYLDCSSNDLTTLDVSKNTALTNLYCSSNNLTTLDVSKNTALDELYCNSNQLTTLDVSKNTALRRLYCYSNQLTALEVSKSTALTYLWCFSNDLTTLDVSKNTALTTLYCHSNNLTELSLVANTSISEVCCVQESLTSLYLTEAQKNNMTITDEADGCYSISTENTIHKHANTTVTVASATYVVSYNANGGTGAPESQTKTQGTALTLSSTVPTKAGSTFKGWATSSTATTAEYTAGGTFTIDANTVLYAVWEEETCAIKFIWTPTEEETEGVSQLIKGVEIAATAETTISWGDGTEETVTAGNNLYTHTYATVGEYTVRIQDNVVTRLDLRRYISNSALSTSGNVTYNQVTSLDVSGATTLTFLSCNRNDLTELDVSKNTALTYLSCSSNDLMTLDVSKNTALTKLYCYSNNLTTLDVSKNTALTILYCYCNNLTTLDVSRNTALTYLECAHNDLTELDISKNTALVYLYCGGSGNNLTALDVSKNTALEGLYCYSNNLMTLDVSNNTALTYLDCAYNDLTTLDVSKNTALTYLSCSSNDLMTLDVSKNTALTKLYCSSNNLTTLDVSKNTALTYLSCSKNGLMTLDLSKNTALEELYCSSNNLTTLDVSKNTALTKLYCYSNNLTELSLVANTSISKVCCVQESLTNLYLTEAQKNNMTITDEADGCNSISTENIIHKHANTAVTVASATYVVSYNVNGGKGTPVSQIKAVGTDLTLNNAEPTKEGYTFKGWSTSSTATVAEYTAGGTFTTDANTVLYAVWKEETCAIKFIWKPTEEETEGVSQLIKGVKITATAATTISWGDGTEEAVTVGNKLYTHTYATAGEYTVRIQDNVVTDLDLTRNISNSALSTSGNTVNNQVTSLDVSKNTALTYLSCYSNQLTTLDVSKNTALTYLDCSSNNLTTLDVSKNTALTSLNCESSNLTTLDVSKNTALEGLNCYDNNLTTLDVSKNTALTYLDCDHNDLTTLDVSKNTALRTLYCSSNNLTTLDVSKNTALAGLYCYSNNLMTLDVSKNTALTTLYCYDNNLTTLDVSGATALTRLDCYINQLTALDVSNNTALTSLLCSSNQLTALDVSGATALTTLYCHSNNLAELSLVANTSISKVCCVQSSLTNLYLNATQQSSMTITDETSGCRNTTANTIHKHANTTVTVASATYVVSYNANGGTGAPKSQTKTQGTALTLSSTVPTKAGSTFKGWATSSTATAAEYTAGGTFTTDANTVLYAVWEEETYAIEFTWTPTEEETEGVSQLIKGVEIAATAETTISWGDGTEETVTVGNNLYTHTYATAGEYTVRIQDNVVTRLDLRRYISNSALSTSGNVTYNQVTSLDVSGATALTFLSCNRNDLTTLDVSKNTALTILYCHSNNLTTLDVSKNTALTYLSCYSNQLTTLDVSKNTALTYLSCSSNDLMTLDLSKNTALTKLYCYSNNLTTLDVSKNTALTYLSCSSNDLMTLDLSKNTALTYLSCYSNQLTTLDLSKNTALTYLSCSKNGLMTLDLSKNTALEELYCYSNNLTTLDLSKNTALTKLYCYSNNLTALDVSKNTALTELYCYSNNLTELSLVANTSISKVCCVQESLTNLYLTEAQKNNMTITDEANGCYSISTENTIHKHANTKIYQGTSTKKTENKETESHSSSSVSGGSKGSGITLPLGIITSKWKNKFNDVNDGDWYYNVIKYVSEKKYFSGTSSTTFAPDDTMTREMFMAALYNMERNPITYGANKYFDVEPGRWSEAAIVWGSTKGLIQGFPDGGFKPEEPVTREQVATILKKYAEYKYKYSTAREELTSFNDSNEISSWAYDSISWAVAKGIMKGDNYHCILPQKSATRAEVAAMFMNYDKMD